MGVTNKCHLQAKFKVQSLDRTMDITILGTLLSALSSEHYFQPVYK